MKSVLNKTIPFHLFEFYAFFGIGFNYAEALHYLHIDFVCHSKRLSFDTFERII